MIGKPKFNYGDKVKFVVGDKEYVGEVWIIDKFGTFEDDSDVSYDIMVKDAFKEGDEYYRPNRNNDCLFKHISEKEVELC